MTAHTPDHLSTLLIQLKQLIAADRNDEATTLLSDIQQTAPGHPEVIHATACMHHVNGLHADAALLFEKALAIQPDNAMFHYNYGNLLYEQRNYSSALRHFRHAMTQAPDHRDVYVRTANLLCTIGRFSTSLQVAQQAHARFGPDADILDAMGNAHQELGAIDAALASYHKAIDLVPTRASLRSNYLMCLCYSDHPPGHIMHIHKKIMHQAYPVQAPSIIRSRHTPLRIGYLSSDLRTHSVACFIEAILRQHHPERTAIFIYADNQECDKTTKRLQGYRSLWRATAKMDDTALLQQIQEDAIDILFDMGGHTAYNRLSLFARRAAPMQITYCGYPCTTGIKAIDYRLTDRWADPPDQDGLYAEQLVRLQDHFLCYTPPPAQPDRHPPCIAKSFITFGSFNSYPKLSCTLLDTWCTLLHRVPSSQMVLKNKAALDQVARQRIFDHFAKRGLDPGRLHFLDYAQTPSDHLPLYNQIDIALDTYPYNGTTTTCEALLMGVPVISWCGEWHAQRVGYSLLHAVGEEEHLVAFSSEEYIDKAAALAEERERLVHYKNTLPSQLKNSLLCNQETFVRQFEETLFTLTPHLPAQVR